MPPPRLLLSRLVPSRVVLSRRQAFLHNESLRETRAIGENVARIGVRSVYFVVYLSCVALFFACRRRWSAPSRAICGPFAFCPISNQQNSIFPARGRFPRCLLAVFDSCYDHEKNVACCLFVRGVPFCSPTEINNFVHSMIYFAPSATRSPRISATSRPVVV